MEITYDMILEAKNMLSTKTDTRPNERLCYIYYSEEELEEIKKMYGDNIDYIQGANIPYLLESKEERQLKKIESKTSFNKFISRK